MGTENEFDTREDLEAEPEDQSAEDEWAFLRSPASEDEGGDEPSHEEDEGAADGSDSSEGEGDESEDEPGSGEEEDTSDEEEDTTGDDEDDGEEEDDTRDTRRSREEDREEDQQPQKTPEQQRQEHEEQRKQAIAVLKDRYRLSDEEIERFHEDPNSVLSEKIANAVYDAVMESQTSVMRELPNVVQQTQNQTRKAEEAERKFYERWPDLADPEHQELAMRSAQLVRQHRPEATLEEVIEEAGTFAMLQIGKDPTEGGQEEDQDRGRGKKRRKRIKDEESSGRRAHKPAGAGSRGPGKPESKRQEGDRNIFEEMTDEFEEDMMRR